MTETARIYRLGELAEQLSIPARQEDFSPLSGRSYILVDIKDPVAEPAEFLRNFQCPVIGIGHPGAPAARACDVIVKSLKDTASLIANITAHPLAAATAVQLLRHNERASLNDGLFAESLAYATLQGGADFKEFVERQKKTARKEEHGPAVLVRRQGDALILTLNRPGRRNAFSTAMRDALVEGLTLLASDRTLKKAILKGAGKCFCIGGDLDEFGSAPDPAQAHLIRSTRNPGRLIGALAGRIECHLHGACIGSGIELPAFAHHLTARKNTFFQLPEITMGLIPGAGGTVSIPRRIGRHNTAYLILSAKRITSRKALEWGLIDSLEQGL